MATVKQIYSNLDKLIPRSLSASWDNDGLLVCPNGEKEVKKVLLALDATNAVVEMGKDFDIIITHHPVIFKPLREIGDQSPIPSKILKLVQNGTAVMSFHTRFDAFDGGINDILANKFALKNVRPFGDESAPTLGRIGDVEKTTVQELAKKVKSVLGSPFVLYTDTNREITKVAICGGDGGSFIAPAISEGADVLITGRGGYNSNIDARDAGLSVIEAGHYFTEAIFIEYFLDHFKKFHPDIEVSVSPVGCEISAL